MDTPPQDCEIDSSGIQSCTKCGKEGPEWTIVESGSGICPDCSGVHRSLSVEKPIQCEQAESNAPPVTDPNIELPSSSSDKVVPPSVEPPLQPADNEDCEMKNPAENDGEECVTKRPRKVIEQASIELIARHFCSPKSLSRDEDPYRVHKLFYNQLRAIPKSQRAMFMHKMDSLCYQYLKNNRV